MISVVLFMIILKWENSILVVVILETASVSLAIFLNSKGAESALLIILLVFLVGERLILLRVLLEMSTNSITSYSVIII